MYMEELLQDELFDDPRAICEGNRRPQFNEVQSFRAPLSKNFGGFCPARRHRGSKCSRKTGNHPFQIRQNISRISFSLNTIQTEIPTNSSSNFFRSPRAVLACTVGMGTRAKYVVTRKATRANVVRRFRNMETSCRLRNGKCTLMWGLVRKYVTSSNLGETCARKKGRAATYMVPVGLASLESESKLESGNQISPILRVLLWRCFRFAWIFPVRRSVTIMSS